VSQESAPPPHPVAPPASGTPGIAIAALITSIAGFLVPLLGIVGIVLGVTALRAARERAAGTGIAVAGIVLGCIATLVMCVAVPVGVLLPALGKARDMARQEMASVQAQQIGQGMFLARQDGVPAPPRGSDFEALLDPAYIGPAMWISPFSRAGIDRSAVDEPCFLLLYANGDAATAEWPTHIVVNPAVRGPRRAVPVASAADGAIQLMEAEEALDLLRRGEVYAPTGRRIVEVTTDRTR